MQIEFVGAAQTVTGSKHLVHTPHASILLDCGLFQGRRREAMEQNKMLGFDPGKLDSVVLSHAHIDHSGALPLLMKRGFDGPIFATPATRDLCAAMLTDAAMIQKQDARFINKLIERDHMAMDPVEPLYDEKDVRRVLDHMISIPYHRRHRIADGVHLTFYDAGHVLGSAITALDVEEGKEVKRVLFTGDLGRRRMPILRDPEIPEGTHALITESTYGDRLHAPIEAMDDAFAAVVKRVYDRGGKIVIPSFALERAQEIIYAIKELKRRGRMPRIPVYVDSPLTVKITDIFKLHPECYDEETQEVLAHSSPFDFDDLRFVSDKEDSKAIDASRDPAIIISASGMCEAGRVLHHLKATIESDKNCVMIVGYQAQHTLGRRIVEKRSRVKIFGVERDLRAEVVVMNGFSAHADQSDLMDFVHGCKEKGHLGSVMLVHGDPQPQKVLSGLLKERNYKGVRVHVPAAGDKVEV
jgi:metallo-beta-lactamase family protein